MSGAEHAGDARRVGDSRKSLSLQAATWLGEETTGIFVYTRARRVSTTQPMHSADLSQPELS